MDPPASMRISAYHSSLALVKASPATLKALRAGLTGVVGGHAAG